MKWFKRIFKKEKEYACPCCGALTLTSRDQFEICVLCGWEDDGQDDCNADEVKGGPNGNLSLTEARSVFKQSLILEKEDRAYSRTEAEKLIILDMLETFEKIKYESDPGKLGVLWDNIRKNFEQLNKPKIRKILR
jgi:hypothetical protein